MFVSFLNARFSLKERNSTAQNLRISPLLPINHSLSFPITLIRHSITPQLDNSIAMADDLRKNLGKAQAHNHMREAEERARANDNFGHWNQALEAHANGWKRPTSKFPVVISTNSPISTPEKLQEIAGLETTPEVIETTYTTLDGDPDPDRLDGYGSPEKVTVGLVDWDQLQSIRDKTDFDHFLFVWLEGAVRGVTLVTSLVKSEGD